MRSHTASGEPLKGVEALERSGLHEQYRNRLLYHLEAGLLYHLAGKYRESNRFLESAEWISDEMYTRSLSLEAAALATSDNLLPYRGKYYDYLFINYYKLLNYLHLGSLESALVEVRRINHKLALFGEENAFLRWVTAVLHRHSGEYSSAFIDYLRAYRAYEKTYPEKFGVQMPRFLAEDIAVFCAETRHPRSLEFPPEVLASRRPPPPEYGSVIFIVETGFSPHKYEKRVDAEVPVSGREKDGEKVRETYILSISVPEYAPRRDTVTGVRLSLNGSETRLELAEDTGAAAVHYFEEERGRIIARAAARAAAKYAAYRTARGDDPENLLRRILGSVVNIAGSATERADTRSWLTLPDRIFMARKYLPPGEHNFSVDILTEEGRESSSGGTFSLDEGELKFVLLRRF